ncbi:galectin-3b [Aplochiton taeniatus]
MSLVVPYSHTLPGGVYDKLIITINGTVKPKANTITVNLNANNDLAFHLNPRFNESGKKVIVRNSMLATKWGKEERELSNFPFIPGQAFELKILCTNSEFKVAVNKSHLLEYKHRFRDLRSINQMGIYGDVTLSSVVLETLP